MIQIESLVTSEQDLSGMICDFFEMIGEFYRKLCVFRVCYGDFHKNLVILWLVFNIML